MKQVFQNLKTGQVEVRELPVPAVRNGCLLIRTRRTLVSPGTERMLAEFGKASWIQKARQQPDKVKQVVDKLKTNGVQPTLQSVFTKLNEPLPLGYCNAGIVEAVGSGVSNFEVGDRVISNGSHSEFVCVPENLCARIPDSVDDDTAAYTVLSAIALQGIRLAEPQLGEFVVVQGLGLIGLLTCQILKANGCQVLGFDLDPQKVELAKSYGCVAHQVGTELDPVKAALDFSNGNGVDAVLITASTKSNQPIETAPQMCRKRGKVVLVGVVGLELSRADFYEKEISFQVSCSYGPGRYEHEYEGKGLDYPIGFVRFTEQRNFQSVLTLMEDGKLSTRELTSLEVPFSEIGSQYDSILSSPSTIGALLTYSPDADVTLRTIDRAGTPASLRTDGTARIGLIGGGKFAEHTLLPALSKTSAELVAIASASGVRSSRLAEAYKFEMHTTNYREVLDREDINTVVIATRDGTHSKFIIEALEAGKHVFTEKPLAVSCEQLAAVETAYEKSNGLALMVGFNRRFSPHVQKAKELLGKRTSPIAMTMTVNAGAVPKDSWLYSSTEGAGRIIGEGCHFIDVMAYLANSPVVSVAGARIGFDRDENCEDKSCLVFTFEDGSVATLNYFANGHQLVAKERLEVFSDGKVLQLHNFITLEGFGFKEFRKFKKYKQDKGHTAEIQAFVEAIRTGNNAPIAPASLFNTTLAAIKGAESCRLNRVFDLTKMDHPYSQSDATDAEPSNLQAAL